MPALRTSPLRARRALLALLALGLASLAPAARLAAQDVAVPVEVQVPLFIKIFAFDRNLAAQPGPLVLGVLFQGKYRRSVTVAEDVRRAVSDAERKPAGGTELRIVLIDLDETPDLAETLAKHRVRVLYVSPLRAVDIRTLTAVSRLAGISTVTGVPRYVEAGLAVGLDLKGERPEIVVNLLASRAEGADLDAQLLKLARIVQ